MVAGVEAAHDDRPWPVRDLHDVLGIALARGGDLLTAGEHHVIRRILALPHAAGLLFARLCGRRAAVYAVDELTAAGVDDVSAALDVLEASGLVDRLVSADAALDVATVARLQEACARLGLRATGRRDALVERLRGRRWTDRPHVRVLHRGLLHRLDQWAFLDRRPDRGRLVVDRLGLLRFPEYALTADAGLHRDRRALLAWEAVWRDRDALPPEDLLAALDRPRWPPGGLDLRPSIVRRVLDAARAVEASEPARARALYEGLWDRGVRDGTIAVRIARTHEVEGDVAAAHAFLAAVRLTVGSIAVSRAGKRVGRLARRGWPPDPPLRRAGTRHLALAAAPGGARPRYETGEGDAVVEGAVAAAVRAAGRDVLRGEGPLWTTLFALLFADAYFLPVPGMLPVRFLSGPLDVGTPAFAPRRPHAIAAVLAAVDRGEAPARVAAAHAVLQGTWLAGAAWGRASATELAALADAMGPVGLRAVLDRLLAEGFAAAAGLPDLVVLPGPAARIDAHPSRLPPGVLLVEVKGPTDALRDEQRVWMHHLLGAGVPVELWHVRPE